MLVFVSACHSLMNAMKARSSTILGQTPTFKAYNKWRKCSKNNFVRLKKKKKKSLAHLHESFWNKYWRKFFSPPKTPLSCIYIQMSNNAGGHWRDKIILLVVWLFSLALSTGDSLANNAWRRIGQQPHKDHHFSKQAHSQSCPLHNILVKKINNNENKWDWNALNTLCLHKPKKKKKNREGGREKERKRQPCWWSFI